MTINHELRLLKIRIQRHLLDAWSKIECELIDFDDVNGVYNGKSLDVEGDLLALLNDADWPAKDLVAAGFENDDPALTGEDFTPIYHTMQHLDKMIADAYRKGEEDA